jgi:hypothetical protein
LKKFLALAFSALFMLGFAASAFAIHAEIPAETTAAVATGSTLVTLGGNIRSRYEYCNACNTFDEDAHDNWTRWDHRGRLNTTVKVAENATGFVSWQAGWEQGNYPGQSAAGLYRAGNTQQASPRTLEAWIQYTGLGPLSFKVGHMVLALGNGMFLSHTDNGDDALIVWADPSEGLHVAFVLDKFNEGDKTRNDDAEAYVGLLTYSTDTFNLGGDITWVNDNSGIFVPGADSVDLYNIALRGDMNFGGVNVYADGNFQTGDTETAGVDTDFGGYAVLAGGKFKAGGMNLGLEFGLGSGDDDPNDTDFDTFIQSVNGRVQYRTFIYSARTATSAGQSIGDLGGGGGAWTSNIMWVGATAGGPISDALSFKAGLYWLAAAEDTAICPTCNTDPLVGPVTTGIQQDDEIGFELDASVNYQLARNLRLWAEGGYLLAGDAFQKVGTGNVAEGGDDAYGIRIGTEMSF